MSQRLFLAAAGLSMVVAALPVRVSAQTTDQILYACYIPLVGVVYRIKAPGLPTACLLKSHIEFSWNAQGPKGDRGDTGPAGNLALAGQSCPMNYFIAGFNSTGGLVCRNTDGQEPPTTQPPPPPPNPFTGNWAVTPALMTNCTVSGPPTFSGAVTLVGFTTSVSTNNILSIQLVGSSFGSTIPLGTITVQLTDPPTFPVAVSAVGGTVAVTQGLLAGSVNYDVTGDFASFTSFSATVSVRPNLFFGGAPVSCANVSGVVTGYRISQPPG